jgi:hypothetical protein
LFRDGLGALKIQSEYIRPKILTIINAVDGNSEMIDLQYFHQASSVLIE